MKIININNITKGSDVLIIDLHGSENIVKTLPNGISYALLSTRGEFIYLSYKLIFFWIVFFFKIRPINRTSIRVSYAASVVKIINAKILVTFIDNNNFLGLISRNFDTLHCISIQNGANRQKHGIVSNAILPTYYYSFGENEIDLFKRDGINYKEVYPMGSLKAGLFYEQYNKSNKKEKNQYDVGIISEYRPEQEYSDHISMRDFFKAGFKLHKFMSRYGGNKKIAVLLSGKDSKNEKKYFDSIYKGDAFELLDRINPYSNYYNIMNCEVVVSLTSTLSYEAMALGKKVLFCYNVLNNGNDSNTRYTQFVKIPEEFILSSGDYNHFEKKINNLIKMDSKKYHDKIKKYSKYVMNFDKCNLPQDIVRQKIHELILKNRTP
jgi:surface carbohydrate biosynthesis protein